MSLCAGCAGITEGDVTGPDTPVAVGHPITDTDPANPHRDDCTGTLCPACGCCMHCTLGCPACPVPSDGRCADAYCTCPTGLDAT